MSFKLGRIDGISFNQLGGIGGGAIGGASNLIFSAPLQSVLNPVWAAGSAVPTFTRATVAYVADWENLLKPVLSGEARFTGARRVRNSITGSSEDWSSGTHPSDVNATTAATTFTLNSVGASRTNKSMTTVIVGRASVWRFRVLLSCSVSRTICIRFNGTGGDAVLNIAVDSTPKIISNTVTLTDSTPNLQFTNVIGEGATDTSTAGTFTIGQVLVEEVTGQSNQNPSEYVSVGVLSAPYHGAGVDGVKYFTTLNGNTVASNVVTEATGAAINPTNGASSSTTDAGGPFGYFAEGAGTQLVTPTASIRDMTDGSWTLGATMTRARTSVGLDGVANSATRLTAGAVAATNIITQTLVAAATSRTYSCYIKRITGTGPVRLTQDNFVGGSDISGSLVAGTWVRVSFTASILNAVYGIKVDTNLDAIDVDFNQFEAGAFATSPMASAGAARNADVLAYPTAGNVFSATGSVYAEIDPFIANDAVNNQAVLDVSAVQYAIYVSTSSKAAIFDGANVTASAGNVSVGTVSKVATNWSGVVAKVSLSGAIATGTFDGSMNAGANMTVGNKGGAGAAINGTIRNVRIFSTALTDAQLQAMTS